MSEDVRVDWLRPIEAVHEDGRVTEASPYNDGGYEWPDDDGQYHVRSGNMLLFANEDGSNYFPELYGGGWRIRNVAQPAQEPRTAPSGGEVGAEVTGMTVAEFHAFTVSLLGAVETGGGDMLIALRDASAAGIAARTRALEKGAGR